MAISVFTGKPGNGKTLTMMHFLAEDLLRTERHVVTNIPVKLPELAEYLQDESDRRKIRCPKMDRRLTVLTTEEALYFWRYRSGGFILPAWDGKGKDGKVLPEEELLEQSAEYFKQIGEKPAFSKPCSYYISEAHRYYNAKRFQRISVIAELYVTHHRHLHDEVYFDTQFAKQLAVALRELTEEWHVLRNDYNRNIGFVKMVPRIRMASYYEMPGGSENKPFEKRSVFIRENGVAGCYNSTAALGAIERAQDVEEKKQKRGIDMRLFIGLVCMGVIGAFGLLAFAPKAVFGIAFQSDPPEMKQTSERNSENEDTTINSDRQKAGLLGEETETSAEPLTVTAWSVFKMGGDYDIAAELSDGRRITHRADGFEGINLETQQLRFRGRTLDLVRRRSPVDSPRLIEVNKPD